VLNNRVRDRGDAFNRWLLTIAVARNQTTLRWARIAVLAWHDERQRHQVTSASRKHSRQRRVASWASFKNKHLSRQRDACGSAAIAYISILLLTSCADRRVAVDALLADLIAISKALLVTRQRLITRSGCALTTASRDRR